MPEAQLRIQSLASWFWRCWTRTAGFALVLLAGAALAFIAHHLWSLQTQHLVVIVAAVVLVSFSMLFLPRFPDFLLVSLLLSIPLAAFTKSFFFTAWDHDLGAKAVMRFSGIVSISVPDILLFGLYALWFLRIVVLRTAPMPRLHKYDIFPLLLLAAYICSIPGSPVPKAALFGVFFLLRHVLLYFYISRHLEARHLPWLLLAFGFAIVPETLLALFQYGTGKWLSLAWSRGAGDALDTQYVVPGIEHIKRATGTTFDSHSFGIYMAMLAPFPFVLAFARFSRGAWRVVWSALFVLASIAIVLSFSRSAWLSAAIALSAVWAVHILWGERRVLLPTAMFILMMLILSPWYAPLIYERFASAEAELLTSRFDQFPVAWAIWRDHFFFGLGVGNYMDALHDYNEPGVLELPVHNVFLWIGAETGLFGVIAFFGLAGAALLRCWRLIRTRREPECVIALAVFGGLFAYLLDGLTDPLFREPVVYMMFWVLVATSVAIQRIHLSKPGTVPTVRGADRGMRHPTEVNGATP